MEQFIVNKTTTIVLAIDAENHDDAEEQALKGEGKVMQKQSSFNVRLREEVEAKLAANRGGGVQVTGSATVAK